MVDYENPYQKKVVAPSNVFCFITQIKTTLLKKLGIIFIFRKKEKKMRPPRPTKRHKNTTKDQASVPSQCHDEPFGNPPPTSPRSVHHAPLELSGVSLKGHEGAAPHGDFSWKKTHWFPKEIQHKSPLSKKKLTEICHANIGRSFFWEKKTNTNLFTHFVDIFLLYLQPTKTPQGVAEVLPESCWSCVPSPSSPAPLSYQLDSHPE